jgi:hypothetical protein
MNPRVVFWFAVSVALALVMVLAFYGAWASTTFVARFTFGVVVIVFSMLSYIASRMALENRSWLR